MAKTISLEKIFLFNSLTLSGHLVQLFPHIFSLNCAFSISWFWNLDLEQLLSLSITIQLCTGMMFGTSSQSYNQTHVASFHVSKSLLWDTLFSQLIKWKNDYYTHVKQVCKSHRSAIGWSAVLQYSLWTEPDIYMSKLLYCIWGLVLPVCWFGLQGVSIGRLVAFRLLNDLS